MDVTLAPTLATLRELYSMPRDMARFRAYLATMTGGTGDVIVPIVNANPMAKEHVLETLGVLEAFDAERVAFEAARAAAARLPHVDRAFRVAVVVADDVGGGWTDRHLTDAEHRFEGGAFVKRGFATALVWTSETPTRDVVAARAAAAVYRAAHVVRHGEVATLGDAVRQEGRVAWFAGPTYPPVAPAAVSAARRVIATRLEARDYATRFAAMYGDEAARRAGHAPLGVAPWAGFAAAAEAAQGSAPEKEV